MIVYLIEKSKFYNNSQEYNKLNNNELQKLLHICCEKKLSLVVQYLVKMGANLDQKCALLSCKERISSQMLKILLDNNISVDFDCFKQLVSNCIQDGDDTIRYDEIIQLVHCGLKFNYDCVVFSLKHNIYIDCLELLGMDYDDNLYELCNERDQFPQTYMSKFIEKNGKESIMLRNMFKVCSPHLLKKYIVLHHLVPDKFCFKNAIKHNKHCAGVLKQFNFSPNLQDILDIADNNIRKEVYKLYYMPVNGQNNVLFSCE
jgi:hypothetical protein